MNWQGVLPAITTPFDDRLEVDVEFLARHVDWLIGNGCVGIVPLGSLGEGATLDFEEKREILRTCVAASEGRVPVVAGIAALSTRDAVHLAREAEKTGCEGLMVLPAYVYKGDSRETLLHFSAVLGATDLPCMIYNNPIAYSVDLTPSQIAFLAERHSNVQAVKESSADVRRITELRAVCGDALEVLVGVDDLIVEGIATGATGWIAGLVNALPAESVRLFAKCRESGPESVETLYRWFLPLLRLDTVPKFVQLIKLVQQEVGMGSERVRPPRLELVGEERDRALAIIREALSTRPELAGLG